MGFRLLELSVQTNLSTTNTLRTDESEEIALRDESAVLERVVI